MNKEKFLTELREYLSILENQEQEDILAEYAQHIDMKMQKGLSEEDAIRDFGAIEELASEILEAYHVKPEAKPKADKIDGNEGFWRRTGIRIKEMLAGTIRRIGRGIRRGIRWLGDKCRTFAGWCSKPFTRGKTGVGEGGQESQTRKKGTRKMAGQMGNLCRATGRGIATAWKWFAGFCIFCLKFMWNMAWLMFGIFCAFMTMIVLMGVGAMPILLAQGYPFVGIFIICLGGLLCLGSLSFGAFSLLIRKKKVDQDENSGKCGKDEMTEKSDKEAAYEQTA